jgi:hypothetical protein
MVMSVSVDNGKYTVQQDDKGNLTALRHGEEWRDCCGDNLIGCLASEVEALREKIDTALECLGYSNTSNVGEACDDAYKILTRDEI